MHDPGPVFELAGGHGAEAHRNALALVPDLTLRSIENDLEVVVAVDERNLELVAPVDAVALVGEQLAVAIELGIPAEREHAAQDRGTEARRTVERRVADEQAAPHACPAGDVARRHLDIAGDDLSRAQRPEHAALGVHPEGPHAQALRNALPVGRETQVETGEGDLAAGEHLVACLEPAAARALPVVALGDHVDRGCAPQRIGLVGARVDAQVALALGTKSRRATFALDGLDEGKRLVAFEREHRVGQVGSERNAEPPAQ